MDGLSYLAYGHSVRISARAEERAITSLLPIADSQNALSAAERGKKINGLLSDSHQERNRKSMTAIRGIKKRRNGGDYGTI
jgi:hypothetical protein